MSSATGISSSFLSLLEQGKTDVSLGRLFPVLEHYGLGIEEVFNDPGPGDSVVRVAERKPVFSAAEGIEVFLTAPNRRHPFTPFVVEYQRGSEMSDWSEHAGEEFVFVLDGGLVVDFREDDVVTLGVGDSLFFASTRAHRISPVPSTSARALVVSTESRVWS